MTVEDQNKPTVPAVVSDPNPGNVEDQNPTVLLTADKPAAVAPVVPVAPVVEAPTDGVVEYQPTGDVGLDMALAFVGKAGIGSEHPAMKAAEAGDFSILKATLAAKGVQGWEQFVALGEAAYARTTTEAKAKAEVAREAIYKEAGGKDAWAAVQQWASTNATPEEKASINAMLNQGGLAAKSAVQYLVGAYGKANNVVVNPADAAPNASRTPVPTDANAPLSAKDYAVAVQALNNKLNGRLEGSREYEALQRRRSAFRG